MEDKYLLITVGSLSSIITIIVSKFLEFLSQSKAQAFEFPYWWVSHPTVKVDLIVTLSMKILYLMHATLREKNKWCYKGIFTIIPFNL